MGEAAIIWEWIGFAVRWTHVIVAIAWIGSSFYFIALDLGLRKAPDLPQGVHGEEWQVHGGGFYHIRKYLVAPEAMPEHLTWFKWESYSTWLTGAALLMIVYWVGAELYLIDRAKADLAVWQAIGISAASLAVGWLAYDALCRSRLGHRPTGLLLLLFGLIVVIAWGYAQVFTGRAALLHLGALTATIMSANVFLVIIPNQTVVVADLKAGRTPDPEFGRIAKLRSTHNNYLTLPVLFLMLSNHAPLAFATEWNWLIASLVFLMGVTIRHWFNTRHARAGSPHWTWAATAVIFVLIMWLSTAPDALDASAEAGSGARRFAEAEGFAEVHAIVQGRCSMCHAAEPFWDGIHRAPKGVVLESEADLARQARQVYLQSALSHAMPPANVSYMEPEERAAIRDWYRAATASRGP
ncbi:urate hydroxylase PuuD [Roseitranquillus sediminis]|uniref:urate hydroxylase PuuD n=1 Tax=Roseitranquillus sediminis TaxID=2809051 RepID=UPI001D0C4031|nr:urate hydroxylase PuuD [Roseitranquillus sediminis]MBM9595244.1 urate hydroxylase PuuD [Roseitranquillus sediminis]